MYSKLCITGTSYDSRAYRLNYNPVKWMGRIRNMGLYSYKSYGIIALIYFL